ncbi:MAG: hypothetical protein IKV09_04415 [Alistipes sp.]|nr:hypothetical protein [Alistipes sp.]
MKRLFILTLALCTTCATAFAWSNHAAATIAEIASRHLTEEARTGINAILGSPLSENCNYLLKERKEGRLAQSSEWHYAEVDSNLNPKLDNPSNAITQIETLVAALRNRNELQYKDLRHNLLTLVNLVSDIHCVANIRIEGIDHSYKNFQFTTWNNRSGKRARYAKRKWYYYWGVLYAARRSVFSTQGYADEIMLFCKPDLQKYSTGTPSDWVTETAKDTRYALENGFAPEATIRAEVLNAFETIHEKCLARAGCHLAVLLNDIFATK